MADPNSPQQFIVQGEPVKSGQLADHLKREPGVKRIAQVAPDVVILSMTNTQANRLKSDVHHNRGGAELDAEAIRHRLILVGKPRDSQNIKETAYGRKKQIRNSGPQ